MASKPWKPEPPFVVHSQTMLESPAWKSLDHNTKKFLERLELEQMKHGGKDNGRLPCTYDDFEQYGVRRQLILRSQRRAAAAGFAKVTQKGRRSPTGGTPALYLLTYLPKYDGTWPTNEWRKYRPNGPTWQTRSSEKRAKAPLNDGASSVENVTTQVKAALKVQKSPQKPQCRKRHYYLELLSM